MIGVILYILYINPVGYPGEITLQINDLITEYRSQMEYLPNLLPQKITLPATVKSAKFMDDATLQEAVDLRTALATKLDRSCPFNGGNPVENSFPMPIVCCILK
jgi:hypothetical protein